MQGSGVALSSHLQSRPLLASPCSGWGGGGAPGPRKRKIGKLHRIAVTAQIELKQPPYSLNSLEPYMSHQTLEYHWGKHYRSHVEGLNKQIVGTELDGAPLEDIILASYNRGDLLPSFNNAAQIWNHEFFWQSMKPGGGGWPSGGLLELIERDFGSFELMLKEFKLVACSQFGSGWAWLTYKANRLDVGNAVSPFTSEQDYKLVVAKTANAVNPLVWDYFPLLAVDLWEHAYYLDYETRRADYISVFMDKLVSWDMVGTRLEMAMAQVAKRSREEEIGGREGSEFEVGDDGVELYMDSENEEWEAE